MPIQTPQWTDFLTCSICCNEYDQIHNPVSLGCGHTLCKLCLSKLQRKQCPYDQVRTYVPPVLFHIVGWLSKFMICQNVIFHVGHFHDRHQRSTSKLCIIAINIVKCYYSIGKEPSSTETPNQHQYIGRRIPPLFQSIETY